MKFLGFWLLAIVMDGLALLVLGGLLGQWGVLALCALPLAFCLSLLERVSSLERERDERSRTQAAEEAAQAARLAQEARAAQERLEQAVMESAGESPETALPAYTVPR